MRPIDADALRRQFTGDDFKSMAESTYDEIFVSAIDAAPTVNPYEWISVEDRLPEDRQHCLVYATIYFVPDHVDDCNCSDEIAISRFYKDFGFLGIDGETKFWMPFPAPPTEKEN